jgi:putative membrane protein
VINILLRLVVSAVAVYVAQWLSHLLVNVGLTSRELVTVDDVVAAFIFAIVLGLLNAIVRPILLFLSCPITLLTLGLFVFVINAVIFWLASALVPSVHVDGFLGALLGSLVVTVCSSVADQVIEGNSVRR